MEEMPKYKIEGAKPLILGIDPGPKGKGSGIVQYSDGRVLHPDQVEPKDIDWYGADIAVIEMVSSYGMAVGMSTFETLIEAGRIMDKLLTRGVACYLVPRIKIKMVLCGTAQAKDPNVRASILARFAASGGGATPQIGTKKDPGPLYGCSKHQWPALGAALWYEMAGPERGEDVEEYRYTEESWMEWTTRV
jgi:hypothetical protein